MAIDTSTPRWLESLSARPVDYSGIGQVAGRYLGALGTTATGSGDEQIDQKSFGDRFRTNLANTYKPPDWRLREYMAKRQYEQGLLQGQSLLLRNELAFKQMQQSAASERELADLASQAADKGNNPLEVQYMGANPITQKSWGNVQLQYSRGLVAKRLDSDRVRINKLVDSLTPEKRSIFLQIPRGDDGMPTPEGWAYLNQATSEMAKQKTEAQFKNLPLPDQIYQRMLKYESEGDDEGADIMRRELESRKAKELNKSDNSILQDAFIRRRQADRLLADPKTKDDAETMRRVLVQKRNAEADIQRLMSHRSQDQTAAPIQPAPAAATAAPATTSETVKKFIYKDGQLVPQ